jgi:hypothetical protein
MKTLDARWLVMAGAALEAATAERWFERPRECSEDVRAALVAHLGGVLQATFEQGKASFNPYARISVSHDWTDDYRVRELAGFVAAELGALGERVQGEALRVATKTKGELDRKGAPDTAAACECGAFHAYNCEPKNESTATFGDVAPTPDDARALEHFEHVGRKRLLIQLQDELGRAREELEAAREEVRRGAELLQSLAADRETEAAFAQDCFRAVNSERLRLERELETAIAKREDAIFERARGMK